MLDWKEGKQSSMQRLAAKWEPSWQLRRRCESQIGSLWTSAPPGTVEMISLDWLRETLFRPRNVDALIGHWFHGPGHEKLCQVSRMSLAILE